MSHVLHEHVVRARLDGDTVVAALVDHVCEHDVVGIHCVEAVSVLDPVFTPWGIYGCGVGVHVVEPHVGSVHDVDGPEGWVFDEDCEVLVGAVSAE